MSAEVASTHPLTDAAIGLLVDRLRASVFGGAVLLVADDAEGLAARIRGLGLDVSRASLADAAGGRPLGGAFDVVVLASGAPADARRAAELIAQCGAGSRRDLFAWFGNVERAGSLDWRGEVETAVLAGAWRRHPALFKMLHFPALEHEEAPFFFAFRAIDADLDARFPRRRLAEIRALHADMTREAGRRSDAYLHRYSITAHFVRPGDTVIDAGCGMGYGAWCIAQTSAAGRVVGLDVDAEAVAYARAAFGGAGRLEYRAGDVEDLSGFGDASVDLVSSFEAIEHLDDPARFLREAARVLRPGGRIIVSVPNRWVDETGRDPNPHHRHVYDWARITGELAGPFIVERCLGQTAGGGFRLGHAPPALHDYEYRPGFTLDTEWCVVVAMKSPRGAERVGFAPAYYPAQGEAGSNLTAFARDYDNPWIVPALVQGGILRPFRLRSERALADLAREVLAECRLGTPDHGKALTVLGYRLLEAAREPEARDFLAQADAYLELPVANPSMLRWQISLAYLGARMVECLDGPAAAYGHYERCAAMDAAGFSAAIATKTLAARYRLGKVDLMAGREPQAVARWRDALEDCERLLREAGWTDVRGDLADPEFVGYFEMADVLELALLCAQAMFLVRRVPGGGKPANFWSLAGETKSQWLHDRDLARTALVEAQHQTVRRQSQHYEGAIAALREEVAAQARAIEEGNAAVERLGEDIRARERQLEELRAQLAANHTATAQQRD